MKVYKLNPKSTGTKSGIDIREIDLHVTQERGGQGQENHRECPGGERWSTVAKGDFQLLSQRAVGIDGADVVVGDIGLESEVSRAGGLDWANKVGCGAVVEFCLGWYSCNVVCTGPVEYWEKRLKKNTSIIEINVFSFPFWKWHFRTTTYNQLYWNFL